MQTASGKVVLITGGAGGFGKVFAARLLGLGYKVCLSDVNSEAGEAARAKLGSEFGEGSVAFVPCDVTSDHSFRAAFSHCKDVFGAIDVLINNAGVGNEKDFKVTIDVNLGGTIRGTELALEHMSKADGHNGGRVVNIASIAGLKTIPFGRFYSATKSGIIHFTRTAGHPFHLRYTGVVIQCLCPSLVDTPFIHISPTSIYNAQTGEALKGLFGKIPLLQPEEVADGLLKLMEDNKPGAVLCLEKDKAPAYVEAAMPSP